GPLAVDLPSLDRAAEDEHHVAVAVVGAVAAVLLGGAAELGHGDDDDVLHAVAHIRAEGAEGEAQLAEAVGHAALLVLVGVPAADIGEGGLDAGVGLDEARDLLEAAAELAALSVLRAGGGRVLLAVDGLDHANG